MIHAPDNRARAVMAVLAGVGVASIQDAVMKSFSGTYPAYEAVVLRGVAAAVVLAVWLWRSGQWRHLRTPHLGLVLLRALIMCSAYFSYIMALAVLPMANSVSIYFTMPFFVAALAGYFLGETVRAHRWFAIIIGFSGVLIMLRPQHGGIEPAALFAFYAAFGYAVSQMMGRHLSRMVHPAVIANWQNALYTVVALVMALMVAGLGSPETDNRSLAFLTRAWVTPTAIDLALMLFIGVLAGLGIMFFITAYRSAEASFVAPFEYSGMIWALLFGVTVFGDYPDARMLMGAALIIGAGLFMVWRDQRIARRSAIQATG